MSSTLKPQVAQINDNIQVTNAEILPFSFLEQPNYSFYQKCLLKFERWKKKSMIQNILDLKKKLAFEVVFCSLTSVDIREINRHCAKRGKTIEEKMEKFLLKYPEDEAIIEKYLTKAALKTSQIMERIHLAVGSDTHKAIDYFSVYAATDPKVEHGDLEPITFEKFTQYCFKACSYSNIPDVFQKMYLTASFVVDVTNPGYNPTLLNSLVQNTSLNSTTIITFFNDALKHLKLILFQENFYLPEEFAFEQYQ